MVGIPTVMSVTAEPFRIEMGNRPTIIEETMSSATVVMRVMNSLRMSCMPFRIR
jgi:hypothetical protein